MWSAAFRLRSQQGVRAGPSRSVSGAALALENPARQVRQILGNIVRLDLELAIFSPLAGLDENLQDPQAPSRLEVGRAVAGEKAVLEVQVQVAVL